MESARAVTYEEGKEFADSLGIKFVETSAKSSVNVEKAFFTMANEIKGRVEKISDNKPKKEETVTKLTESSPVTNNKGCC